MHLTLSTLLAGIASIVAAKTIRIDASDYEFKPASTVAAKGDILEFHFLPRMHNAVQGSFDKACNPLAGGFYSGDMRVPTGEGNVTFSVEVKDDKPIWFYCSVGSHCQDGMGGVVNPPNDQTIEQYKAAAKTAYDNVGPVCPAGYGGILSTSTSTSTPPVSSSAPPQSTTSTSNSNVVTSTTTSTSGVIPTSSTSGNSSVTSITTTVGESTSTTVTEETGTSTASSTESPTIAPSSGAMAKKFQAPVALVLVAGVAAMF